ncbi:glycosyltransferase family 2 protein [Dyella soli]|uniref:Glycosyltransferase family 2 protein n=1 Tax=Dyella soli TaxID=522319 RepID=A0A4R0YNF5_9GAMM|nr:glycosyltransferase family 2 protein [Dyella soli]TCI10457.1 glycosyltransferase family 2 protein [Dyella soli]
MSDDLVSVIMPAYNAALTIGDSAASVLAQTHPTLELIVVDDGSRDDTRRLVDAMAMVDPRVRLIALPANAGVAAARNAGIAAARGSYIAFLDSDDRWHPRKLQLQLEHLRRSGARIAYAAYDRVDRHGRVLSHVRPPRSLSHAELLKSNHIGNLTGIYHRSLGDARFRAIGHEDYAFWLEMLRRAGKATCVPSDGALAWYLAREDSLSSDKLRAARWQWRIYRDIEQLGRIAASRYMCHYAWQAVRKRS